MDWREALEIVVARSGNERFRELTSDGNPSDESRRSYRKLVVTLAERKPLPAQSQAGPTVDDAARVDALIAMMSPIAESVGNTAPARRKCCG